MGGIALKSKIGFLTSIFSIIRYRFFFFAGILPYLLGQAMAFDVKKSLDVHYFWLGFLGIFFVLIGVELFNEYFDAKEGGDRIFLQEKPNIPSHFFPLAICSMLFAFFIGLYLSFLVGWPILLFSLLGFLGAYFYVGPPLRWAYRGLGEIAIAISYGPFMVLGSYYLQTKRIDSIPFIASLILGLSIFSLAILNEIPDYIQDKLVGKKNIVVRFGKQKSIKIFALSLLSMFIILGLGIWWKKIHYISLVAYLMLPTVLNSIRIANDNKDKPTSFAPAIRSAIFTYIIVVSSIGIGYIGG